MTDPLNASIDDPDVQRQKKRRPVRAWCHECGCWWFTRIDDACHHGEVIHPGKVEFTMFPRSL